MEARKNGQGVQFKPHHSGLHVCSDVFVDLNDEGNISKGSFHVNGNGNGTGNGRVISSPVYAQGAWCCILGRAWELESLSPLT